jgi:hypothetical protein
MKIPKEPPLPCVKDFRNLKLLSTVIFRISKTKYSASIVNRLFFLTLKFKVVKCTIPLSFDLFFVFRRLRSDLGDDDESESEWK